MAQPTARDVVYGVCPVVETPFDAHGRADSAALSSLVVHLANTGADAVMYPAFASEVLSLSDAERDELTDVVIDTGHRAGLRVVASVPDHAAVHAVRRARRYANLGADAVNILPPHQIGPPAAEVRAHVRDVLAAIAPLPGIVQLAPAETGLSLGIAEIGKILGEAPNLAQLKVEAVPAGPMITALAAAKLPVTAIVGYGGVQLIDALRRGAVAVQPGCSFTELYVAIVRQWRAGQTAEAIALHTRLLPYLSYWMQGVNLIVAAEKRISWRRGLIPTDLCRSPRYALDRFEADMIDRFLAEFDAELRPHRDGKGHD